MSNLSEAGLYLSSVHLAVLQNKLTNNMTTFRLQKSTAKWNCEVLIKIPLMNITNDMLVQKIDLPKLVT